jgi:hypothetical protein
MKKGGSRVGYWSAPAEHGTSHFAMSPSALVGLALEPCGFHAEEEVGCIYVVPAAMAGYSGTWSFTEKN